MATEIAILPLKAREYPDNPSSAPGQALKECFKTLCAQKGMQRLYWGRTHEDPDIMRLFVDWDSVQHHKDFIGSDAYKPFLDRFSDILGGDPVLYHAKYDPHPPSKVLNNGGVTEVIAAYFPSSYSAAEQKTVHENFQKLLAVVEKHAEGYKGGAAGGWVEEEQPIPDTEETGKMYSGLIGWETVQAHLDFRTTDVFKENIHLLRGGKDLKGVKVVHVPCVEVPAAK